MNKKTIYVDVDDEITAVIDKVRSAKESIIALVLPKRAAVFQSSVNMKLLKRSVDQDGKKVVLITSEASIMPLAGLVGIHVAHNLNAKPFIPKSAMSDQKEPLEVSATDEPIEIDPNAPIGSVTSLGRFGEGALAAEKVEPEPIEIDNRPKVEDDAAAVSAAMRSKSKSKKNNKLKVPDFNKFRVLLFAGGGLLVLSLIFAWWALFIAPKATVTIKGETSDASLEFDITADTKATTLDEEDAIVPAKSKDLKKTDTEKVSATGQKDKGNKASGTMTLKNCSSSDGAVTIPAGTGVSSGDFTFITQDSVTLDPSLFTGSGSCKTDTKEVGVIAQNGGDKYNISARSYSVAGYNGVVANGSAMTGGTSQLVKVVSAADIDQAKQKLTSRQASAADELKSSLKADGYIGMNETLTTNTPTFTPSPAVDSEAAEVTVTSETTYTMIGIKQSDIKTLIEKEAGKKLDTSKQKILDDGLADAIFQIGAKKGTKIEFGVRTKVVAGPDVNQDEIAKEIAGKKRGEAEQLISARPGIKEVKIDTKPFFNYKVPKKTSKITFVIQQADGTTITP